MGAAGKLKAVAADLEKKEQQVAESEKIASRLEETRLDYIDTRAQIRNLESSVTTQAYVPTLLKQLERLGESVNLKVQSVRPQASEQDATKTRKLSSARQASQGDVEQASAQKPGLKKEGEQKEEVKPYDELKIELELEGKFANVLDFLHGMTSFPKIIAVDNMDVSPVASGLGLGSPNLNVKMRVTACVLKDDKPAKEPEAPGRSAAETSATGTGRIANEAG
jgi:Tfp pilus assembly protein PilO